MAYFRVVIEKDNAAFREEYDSKYIESARILREIAEKLDAMTPSGDLRDVNGNRIGDFGFYA